MLNTIKNKKLHVSSGIILGKKHILTILISLAGVTSLLAADYEKGMQKGLEMLTNATTIQATVDVTNYFERIAEANKSEWLPLYYAAYASLSVGFQQEKTEMKDEWYKKGIAFIERATSIKKDESELIALKGYLQLMYISNSPMLRAPMQTGDAIELLDQAKALNPANPRPWLIQGQNTFHTPEFFGGGADKAKPLLEKASALYKTFIPSNSLMPVWGKDRSEKLLDKCNQQKK